ncbi:MAG: hypothetical protein KC978_04310 [Candidatus Omnitrophica bacterium]|nr:hypothetical protein [Candidatus Omnitrophota bacterium]
MSPFMLKKTAWICLFVILVPALLFHLRHLRPSGGDTADTLSRVESSFYLFLHAPMVTAGHRALWLGLDRWNWTPAECVSLSSSLAGGFFFAALFRFSTSLCVWLPFLLSKSIFIFLGHVENYAWPFALSLWAVVVLKESMGQRKGARGCFIFLGLAAVCHPITLMAWPGAIYALYPWRRRTVIVILVAIISLFGLANLLLITLETAGHFQGQWILPLAHGEQPLNRYTLFSSQHWWEVFVLHALNMPLGILLLMYFGWGRWNGWQGGLILTVCLTLAWSMVWDPTLSYDDWDLFAWPAIFVNLAGGWRWAQSRKAPHAPAGSPLDFQ